MRLLLVDDHEVVRLGLRALLENEPDMVVVGEAGSAADAVRLTEELCPDVVLMDVRLPDESGLDACRWIRSSWPNVQVLILTSFADDALVMDAVEAGAAGYVLKQLDTAALLRAIRAVGQGDAVLDPAVTRAVLARARRDAQSESSAFSELSERELEILCHVTAGRTNAEIASELSLSEKTVRNHVSAILVKLGLTNRIEAATFAVRHHIDRYCDETR